MDWLLWVVRAVLIAVGIILAIVIWKGRKEGRHQEYSLRFFTIGITTAVLGVILLIISYFTELSFFYSYYLAGVGAISIIIGLVVRKFWERKH